MKISKLRCALGCLSMFLAGGLGAANTIAFKVSPGETNAPPRVEVSEGEGVLKLRLRREGDLGVDCGVSFDVAAGTAQPGTDYSTVGDRVVFKAGEEELEFGVNLIADSLKEGGETFSVVLYAPDAGWTLAAPSEVRVTLQDTLEGPSLVSPTVEVWEDGGAVSLAVWRGPDVEGLVSVEYATRDLTAVAGRDYVATNGVLELGEGENFGWIEVGLVNGAGVEGTRKFEVLLGRVSSGVVLPGLGRTEVTMVDDERGFAIPVSLLSVREDEDQVWIPVIRQGDFSQSDRVGFEVSGEGALAGEDYVATNGVVVFEAGEGEKWISVSILNDGLVEGMEAFRLRLRRVEGGGAVGARADVLVQIIDNDEGVRLESSYSYVEENAGELVVAVLRGDDGPGEVSVHYRTEDASAVAGVDYEAVVGVLVFAAGEVRKEVVVPILEDGLTEGYETLRFLLEEVVGGELGWPREMQVGVTDNDPGVHFDSSYLHLNETAAEAVLAVRREDDGVEPVEVAYATVDGTAVAGADYVATNGVLRFEGRGSRATLRVQLANDVLQESYEAFRVVLTPISGSLPADWSVGADVMLIDNDTGIRASGGWADEGSGTLEFVVQCQRDVAGPVTVDYETVPGTATAGLDYESASGTLELVPGGTVKVQVQILGDSIREDYETVRLRLSNPTGGVSLTGEMADGTIMDNDPGVTFESAYAYLNEGDGSVVLRVRRQDDSPATWRVRFRAEDGTAVAGADYEPLEGELEMPPGGGAQEIAVRLVNDQARENYESFNVVLESATGEAVPGLPATASVSIYDDDYGVQFASPNSWVEEGMGQVTLPVTRGNDASTAVSVEYRTENGAAVGGQDYVATNGVLTFAVGEWQRDIVVRVFRDEVTEGQESFRVRLLNPEGGVELGEWATATVWIPANGPTTESTVRWTTYGWFPEADGWITLQLGRTGDLSRAASVDYRTEDLEAVAGQDYEHASGTVVFEPGQRQASVQVRLREDSIRETAEAFRMVLWNARGGMAVEGSGEAWFRIEDDDRGVWWETTGYSVSEEGGAVEMVVRYQSDATGSQTIHFATVDGTARAGEDYVATNGTWVVEGASGMLRVRVPILNDGLQEGREEFGVEIWVEGGGMQVDGQAQASVWIEDNDPGISMDWGMVYVEEGAGLARVRVLAQTDTTEEFTVDYVTLSDSAIAGEDFVSTNGTLVFGAGVREREIEVRILNDGLREEAEDFAVRLSNPSWGVGLWGQEEGRVRIQDNDMGIHVVQGSVQVNENQSKAVVQVRRDDDMAGPVTVRVATRDDTAVAGEDYAATAVEFTLAGRGSVRAVELPLLNDGEREDSEVFWVEVVGVDGGWVAEGQGGTAIWIQDNDPGVWFDGGYVYVQEGSRVARCQVRVQADVPGPVSVDYATEAESALAGQDYVATNGTLVFETGTGVREIEVPILNDGVREASETFRVRLSNPSGGLSMGERAEAVVNIQDDDRGIWIGWVQSAEEGTLEVQVQIRREDDLPGSATVRVRTQDETAVAGEDYEAVDQVITLEGRDAWQTVWVPLVNDGVKEGEETFRVVLSEAQGSWIDTGAGYAGITIRDNDPGVSFAYESSTAFEGTGLHFITVRRRDDLPVAVSVDYRTIDDTAVAGRHYAATNGTLVFQPGETGKDLAVQILNDAAFDSERRFKVQLSGLVGGVLSWPDTATVMIQDNDTVNFEGSAVGQEDDGSIRLLVRRGDPEGSLSVDLATEDETAQAGLDYVGTNVTVHFSPGETVKPVRVTILNDGLIEGLEGFGATLSDVTGGAVLQYPSTISASIEDNDSLPGVETMVFNERAGVTNLVVLRGNDGLDREWLRYEVVGGTATREVDYVLADGRLEFGSGVTQAAVPFVLVQNPDVEPVETVLLLLRSELSGATNMVELKIEDEERPLLYDGSWRMSSVLAWQVQPDGRLVVSSPLDEQSSQVMRMMPDGTWDPDYVPWLTNVLVSALARQSDGSVVCGGGSVCFRLTQGGLLDPAFQADTGGKLVDRITVLPGDRLAVALRDSADSDRVTVERWEADGSRDSSFAGVELSVPPPESTGGSGGWYYANVKPHMEPHGDGLLVAGDINGVDGDGTPRAMLRLAVDGTPDPAFQCSLGLSWGDPVVHAVAVDDQDRIVVAGRNLDVEGENWGSVVRLRADGSVDPAFRCGLPEGVEITALAIEAGGMVLAGASDWGGETGGSGFSHGYSRMVRLHIDGHMDDGLPWILVSRTVTGIWVNSDGTAFAASGEPWYYPQYGRLSALQRVFLHPETVVGAEFAVTEYPYQQLREGEASVSWTVRRLGNTAGSLAMRCLTVDQSAVAGRDYEGVDVVLEFGAGEVEKTVMVRLLDDGEVEGEESFRLVLEPLTQGAGVGLNSAVHTVILDNEVAPSLDRGYGGEDAYFPIHAMAMQEDGRLVAVIDWQQEDYRGYAVVRLDLEGRLDTGFGPFAVEDSDTALALQPGGRVLVFGYWSDRGYALKRLLPDGRPDPGFEVLEGEWLGGLVVDVQSRIWVVRYDDSEGRKLERLLPDGGRDASFTPVLIGYDSNVMPVPLASGGAILVREGDGVARVKDNGLEDESFHEAVYWRGPGYRGWVEGLAELPDGGILVWGDFAEVDGIVAHGLARLGADGVVDEAFTRAAASALPWIGGQPPALAGADHAGRVLVLIHEHSYEGERNRVVRLKSDGSVDRGFGPVSVDWDHPPAVAVDPADNVVLGGAFRVSREGGWTGLARFFETTPAALVELEEAEFAAGEGQGSAEVRVVRRGDVSGSARVRWRTGAGTAVEGADYRTAGGEVSFGPLETEKTFEVPLLDDAIEEAEEWFAVTLFESEGAMLGGLERGRVWVTDNDLQGSIDSGAGSPYAGWIAEPEAEVVGLAVQPGGGLLAWGNLEPKLNFRSVIVPAWALHRLNADGSRDASFVAPSGFRELVGVRRDGGIVVTVDDGLVRLGRDGGIEETLVDLEDWQVQRGALDEQDRIYLLVRESGWSGSTLWLVRFLEDGQLDPGFQMHAMGSGDSVGLVSPLQDGRVLLAGQFERRGGQRRCLKVLTQDGMPDESFVGGWFKDWSYVSTVAECPDGALLVGGEFAGAENEGRVATVMRLDRFGTVDAGFGGGSGAGNGDYYYSGISSLVRLWDGRIVVAGRFNLYDGVPCSGAVLLESNGRGAMALGGEGGVWFAEGYNSNPGVIRAAAVMGDRLWLGGWFNSFAGHDQALLVGVVLTPALGFAEPHVTEDGLFRFGLEVQPGRTYVLEGSEDLQVWTPLSTNTAAADRLWFDDLDTPGNRRMFFRAVRK